MAINSLLEKIIPCSANIQFLLLDSTYQLLHISPDLQSLLGYSEKDFFESKILFSELIHSDDQDITSKLFSLKLQEIPKIVNFRCRHANGRIICLQGCYQKHYTKSTGLKLVLHLTDAKTLNYYLDDPVLLSNFTTMMKNSDDYIYFKDRIHVFTGASQTLVNLTDPSEYWTDLIGKTDYDVFPEEYADAYYRLEKQIFSGIPVANEIQKILDNQGNIGWIDNRKYPIFDKQGEIIGLFGIARDITETIVNKQKVEQLLGEQKAILENQLTAIATVKNGKFVWANPAFIDLFGYKQNELAGMSSRKLYVNDNDYQSIGAAYADIASQDIVRNEFELLREDGQQVWVNMSGKILNREEDLSLWNFVDVTELKRSELALQNSNIRFRALFESHGDAVLLLDNKGIFNCNKATLDIFGCSAVEELCSHSPDQLSPPIQPCGTSSFELAKQNIALAEKQGSLSFEWIHKRIDNDQVFPAEVLLTTMMLDNKLVIQGIVRDITERKQAEKEHNEALNRLQKISNNAPGMVFQFCLNTDGSSAFPYASSSIQEFFRVSPEEAKEDSSAVFSKIHPDDYEHVIDSINVSKETFSQWHEEFRVQFSDGTINWLLGTSLPENGEKGSIIWHGFITDITDRKKMEEQIHQLAFYDELTKLANRRLLNDRLKQSIAASKRSGRYGAAFILDLDNFKPLNDAYGHLVGDLLLIDVANRLKNCVREIDTVARFGGDEFVVLLNDLDINKNQAHLEAEIIANKVLTLLAKPYFLSNKSELNNVVEHHSSASIGVSMFNNDLSSNDDVLGWADAAMYQAKDAGRNQVCFHHKRID